MVGEASAGGGASSAFRAISKRFIFPRNLLMAKAFFWIRYAEDVGSGTSKIIQWCREWGLPEPTYEEAGASFVTVFYNPKPEEGSQSSIVKSAEKDFGENAEKIWRKCRESISIH